MTTTWTVNATNKIEELKNLLAFYESAIARQEDLLERVVRGKYRVVSISDNILYALVRGDLRILTSKKKEILSDIENLEQLNEDNGLNGYHSARSDSGSDI